MFKRIATTVLTLFVTAAASSAHAEPGSCSIEFAVATPPIDFAQNVAFNIANDQGISRSITLPGGSAPHTIADLPCAELPYVVSATTYAVPTNKAIIPFSDCILRSDNGLVWLRSPNSSVSVVFPNDFQCR